MSAPIPAELIAEALAKHPYRRQDHCTIAYRSHCHCGWTQDVAGSHKSELELHAAHQASVIAALPDIAIVPTTAVELVYPTDQQIDDELKLCGFNPSERYPEHGHDALRTAWREGWDSANRPAGGES